GHLFDAGAAVSWLRAGERSSLGTSTRRLLFFGSAILLVDRPAGLSAGGLRGRCLDHPILGLRDDRRLLFRQARRLSVYRRSNRATNRYRCFARAPCGSVDRHRYLLSLVYDPCPRFCGLGRDYAIGSWS